MSLMDIFGRAKTGVEDYVSSKDDFGTGVALNFRGEDTYNTFPGGLLSMVMMAAAYCYAIMKFKAMVNIEDWSLV